jgi:flagellar export protein FliJ
MKKFQFRLEPVLRVRRIQEEQARARLMEANRDAAHAAARVEQRLTDYERAPRPAGVLTFEAYERAMFHLDAAAAAVGIARAAHRDAIVEVEARRAAWTEAKQRVATLERLEDRRRLEHAIAARRDEDRLVDDLVVARHTRTAVLESPA